MHWRTSCVLALCIVVAALQRGDTAFTSQIPGPAQCGVFHSRDCSAFAQPPLVRGIWDSQTNARRGQGAAVGETLQVSEAIGGGGSFKGTGGGGRWDGRGDGWQGGGQDGRFNGLAFVPSSGPRLTNKTVIEEETGIKFPPALLLDPKDKSTIRFLGAGCTSHRIIWKLFKKQLDYAVGLYIDADSAYKEFKKKLKTPEQAQEALLQPGVTKTLRLVLARESDVFKLVQRINDKIESKMAKESFGDLMWLKIWRDWLVYQGGYHQTLPKGVEIRFTWKIDVEEEADVLITEIRRRDRVLATKVLECQTLAKGVFNAFLGENPISPTAKSEVLSRMMNLCR